MSFADEVEAESKGRHSTFKAFVDSQPDAAEIWQALRDRPGEVGKIHRALEKRGYTGSESTVFRWARLLKQTDAVR